MKPFSQRLPDAFLWLQGITGLATLSFLMYVGSFSRYWADDFCYIGIVKNTNNLFAAVKLVYVTWSNRYTNVLFVGILNLFGPDGSQFFPGIMIALMAIVLFVMLQNLARFLNQPIKPLLAANLAILLTFFTILQTPNRFQSVYWMMGLVTYFTPVIFLALMIAIAASAAQQKSIDKLGLILLALLAFLAGGLSETTLAFQITFFTLALAAALFLRKNTALPYLGLTLVISLLALLVVFLAPGNSVRLENIPESEFSLSKIPLIFIFALDFIQDSLRSFMVPAGISVLSAFGLGLILFNGQKLPARFWLAFVFLPVAAYTLIASLVAPSVYVYGDYGYPEPRALFPAQFVLTAALMAFGLMLGRLAASFFHRQAFFTKSFGMIAFTTLFLLVSAYPIWFLAREIPTLPETERYAQTWDERDAFLREQQQQGNLDIVLDGIQPPGGLIELRETTNFWVNACVADFYELNSIAVFP